MGNKISNSNIGFDDMKYSIDKNYIIITTLSCHESTNLIKNTIFPNEEENTINKLIESYDTSKHIIIYGKNSCDSSVYLKYNELKNFGFINVFIYNGGIFEWMLLQDIYGFDNFPTTINEIDILKFKQASFFEKKLLNQSLFFVEISGLSNNSERILADEVTSATSSSGISSKFT